MRVKFLTSTAFFATDLVLLCCIALFFSSRHFVNQDVTPKWFGLIACIVLAGITFVFSQRKVYIPAKALFLLILVSCSLVFFRDWAVLGFNSYLLMQTVCIILLFFVLQQTIPVLQAGYLFGTLALLVTVLAFYGLLQYAGALSSANSFRITGCFDNPAGFAAALACVFPYVFYFFRNSRRAVGYISAVIASIILFTVVLSGCPQAETRTVTNY